jgi:hypothetical protein
VEKTMLDLKSTNQLKLRSQIASKQNKHGGRATKVKVEFGKVRVEN